VSSLTGKLLKVRGFTLLEVVVAMTIVGLGVVTVLEIFSLGMRLGARSSIQSEAISYGRQIMDEFLAHRKWDDRTEQGKLDDGRRWKLRVQTVRQPLSTVPVPTEWELKELVLDVVVADLARERHLEINTLRLVKREEP
jgi:prepilin-type N-terminal cleavage/methylation domain-containing protein